MNAAEHRQVSLDAGHDGSWYTVADLHRVQGRRLAELRRSSAATKHGDRRTKRRRDRGAANRAALNDQH